MTNRLEILRVSDLEGGARRVFDAPRQLVWDCHTKPELVRRWLLGPDGWTMTVAEIDLRVGGKYRHEMRHKDGREVGWGGVYREIVAPEKLMMTELFDEDWTGGETLVTQTFAEHAGKTTLTMIVRYSSKQALDAALKTGMMRGVEIGYQRLDDILTSLKVG
jgi:uncharacterized protein YndB with AHSA1/START domain